MRATVEQSRSTIAESGGCHSCGSGAAIARSGGGMTAFQRATRRLRGQSPLSRSVTARQDANMVKQEELFGVLTPNQAIQPGENFTVTVQMKNHADFINPFDPDDCGNQVNSCSTEILRGYCVNVIVDPEWTGNSVVQDCDSLNIGAANTHEVDIGFPGPSQPGTYTIDVHLELAGSGETTESVTRSITFSDEGASACSNDSECPSNWVCRGGTCSPPENGDNESDGPFGGLFSNVRGILILVAIIVVVSQVGGIAENVTGG